MNTQPQTQHVLAAIPRELDADGWQLRFDGADIRVYSKLGACGAPVHGFKTVTEYTVPKEHLASLLADVVGAMSQMNETFHSGRSLQWEGYPGDLVKTCFALPWPLQNREFVHGIAHQVGHDTDLIAYVPAHTLPVRTYSS